MTWGNIILVLAVIAIVVIAYKAGQKSIIRSYNKDLFE